MVGTTKMTLAGRDAAIDPATSLGYVQLTVSDLAAAAAFYHGVLGFDVNAKIGGSAEFVSESASFSR